MNSPLVLPVIRGAHFFMAHTPGLVRYGSKPARDLAADPALEAWLSAHLRGFAAALAYPPNQVMLGNLSPDALNAIPRPWYAAAPAGDDAAPRRGPFGELMPEDEFLACLKLCDAANLVSLDADFCEALRPRLAGHPLISGADLERLRPEAAGARAQSTLPSLPLRLGDGLAVGSIRADHELDDTLSAPVLLENLACKATAVLALRSLLAAEGVEPTDIGYLFNSGEEAVGDRYQRGGGNLAKAVGELCGCTGATGVDIKAFCCGPLHALIIAAGLVRAGLYRHIAVVGGCSLAKLGMKYQGHLQHEQPILEDLLVGVAVLVSADDGRSPVLRLDGLGRHTVAAGTSQQAILEALVVQPLEALGLRFADVDKYATELHNPETTEPSGSGNVPLLNYRTLAGLAALRGEIAPADAAAFVAERGMPGFSPTQGHIASALPYLPHALAGLRAGTLRRVMLLAKGSLFLGRMTQMADGMSFLLEPNPRR